MKLAFHKRKTSYLYVKEGANTNMQSFGDAAAAIDLENFKARPAGRHRTLDQWLTIQKASDPNVADRAARTIDVGVDVWRIARRQEESSSNCRWRGERAIQQRQQGLLLRGGAILLQQGRQPMVVMVLEAVEAGVVVAAEAGSWWR
jgi:hypothetical protein